MAYPLINLPTSLKLLFLVTLTVIILALAWINLVWFTNFPPSTWKCVEKKERRKAWKVKKKEQRHRSLSVRTCAGAKKGGDVDQQDEGQSSATDMDRQFYHAYSTEDCVAIPPKSGKEGIELTTYGSSRSRPRPTSPISDSVGIVRDSTSATHQNNNVGIGKASPSLPNTPNFSSSSAPITPWPCMTQQKPAPASIIKPRSSSEWLHQRVVFFSPDKDDNNNASSSGYATPVLDTLDMQALEEGTMELLGCMRVTGCEIEQVSVLQKSLSWLDHGLGMVDGAVDKVVERVARWTDDDGGDEPLLLPVANEKVVKVE